MISLSYVSSATSRPSDDDLMALLKTAHRMNASLKITGLLLYNGKGTFIQVLEGDDEVVDELYAKIKQDERHVRVHCIARKQIDARQFSDWRMGFRYLSRETVVGVDGFSEFMAQEDGAEYLLENASFAEKMLGYFRQSSGELRF